jgi:nucleotide-binding universal stress UspA family protein
MIVVGVDGSDPADAALEFAAREAALRDAPLRVVCAWEVPPVVYAGGFAPGLDQSTIDGFREGAEKVVQDAVARAKKLEPTIACEGKTAQGQPADVLLDEGRRAGLMVVGNRGRGGFKSLLLGSVSQQVVHYASCPVVVVRQADDDGEDLPDR